MKDLGKINDNFQFYQGYEGEPEVELTAENPDTERLHIWEGYFDDIFGSASFPMDEIKGFTRDYLLDEGAFSDDGEAVLTDLQEYLEDMKQYQHYKFRYEDTAEVFALLYQWLECAAKNHYRVIVRFF